MPALGGALLLHTIDIKGGFQQEWETLVGHAYSEWDHAHSTVDTRYWTNTEPKTMEGRKSANNLGLLERTEWQRQGYYNFNFNHHRTDAQNSPFGSRPMLCKMYVRARILLQNVYINNGWSSGRVVGRAGKLWSKYICVYIHNLEWDKSYENWLTMPALIITILQSILSYQIN